MTTYDAALTPTAERLRACILAALKAFPKLAVTDESNDADWEVEELRVELESLGNTTPGVDISTEEAITELNRIRTELRKLSGRTDSIAARGAMLAALVELDKFRPPPKPTPVYNDDDIATYYGTETKPYRVIILVVLAGIVLGVLLWWLMSAGTAGTTY